MNRSRLIGILLLLIVLTACRSRPAQASADSTTPTTAAGTPTPDPPTTSTPPAITPLAWQTGINDYTLEVDSTPRQFLVYVPASNDPDTPTPVVFMFHGSNQSGKVMYENTRWREKADEEGFIVVYPTSWKYRTIEENKVQDKWNVPKMPDLVVPGTELKDDVKFVRVLVDTAKATFNVNSSRIYASGFSNGGGFVLTRLVPEMHDIFAAFGTSGAGLWGEGKLENPPTGIDASVYSILGSQDKHISENTGHALPFPMLAEDMVTDEMLAQMFTTTVSVLSLSPDYEVVYDRPSFATLTFSQSQLGRNNRYIFRMVSGMGHVYPSGDNNRAGLDAADLFWDFFDENQMDVSAS